MWNDGSNNLSLRFGKTDLVPNLTFAPDFHIVLSMKTMFQGGLNGHVPVPPEKRFLIHGFSITRTIGIPTLHNKVSSL